MIFFTITILAFATSSHIESPNTIPLNTVWAWDMPGTTDVRELEPNRKEFEKLDASKWIKKSVAMNTRWRLNPNFKPKGNKNAGSVFVVDKHGLEALKEANRVLSGDKVPKSKFESGHDLTLVFFAYGSSQYVHIDQVMQANNTITVRYHFHTHGHRKTTQHYALVPLGKELKGRITVDVQRMEDTHEKRLDNTQLLKLSELEAKRLVSGPTVFHVSSPPD